MHITCILYYRYVYDFFGFSICKTALEILEFENFSCDSWYLH